jgi:hypothetical protein
LLFEVSPTFEGISSTVPCDSIKVRYLTASKLNIHWRSKVHLYNKFSSESWDLLYTYAARLHQLWFDSFVSSHAHMLLFMIREGVCSGRRNPAVDAAEGEGRCLLCSCA